jgi:hypothetical protein
MTLWVPNGQATVTDILPFVDSYGNHPSYFTVSSIITYTPPILKSSFEIGGVM